MNPLFPKRRFSPAAKITAAAGLFILVIIGLGGCNKHVTGGIIPHPTICNITNFSISDSGGLGAVGYAQLLKTLDDGDHLGNVLLFGKNIDYLSYKIYAHGNQYNQDTLFKIFFDPSKSVTGVVISEWDGSFILYLYGYKPGSTLPDSLYISQQPVGGPATPYTLIKTFEYDNLNRLSKVNYANAGGRFHQFKYNSNGDLTTVIEGNSKWPGSPILYVNSYDSNLNCMRTNKVWETISGLYSAHNPVTFTLFTYPPDQAPPLSTNYTLGYNYGGLFNNLPTRIFDYYSPDGGSIDYACTISVLGPLSIAK